MPDSDRYLQQVMQYTAQSINWMRKSFGAELSVDIALECASRMALAAAMLHASGKSDTEASPESTPSSKQDVGGME